MEKPAILIVEDETVISMNIQSILEMKGYRITGITSSGEEALHLAEEMRPDIILMDVVLEGEMDGITAAESIKAHQNIPIIYLTAYSDEETLCRVKETDPDGYILKPITQEELYTSIEIALHKHRMEMKLRESEERYRMLVETMNDGLLMLDRKGIITYVNRMFLELTGYAEEEIIGRSPYDFLDDSNSAVLTEQLEKRQNGISKSYELLLIRKNGKQISTIISPRVIYDAAGTFNGSFGIITDITERREAEIRIQEERNRAQLYLDTAEVMLVAINEQGIITLINQKGCRILGYREDELIGLNWFENILPERLRDEVYSVFRRLTTGEFEPVEYFENPVITKEGMERLIAWHNALLHDESGSIIGTLSSGEDITERKRAEESLKERMRLDHLLFSISAGFINLPAYEVDREIENALKLVVETLEIDRSSLLQFSDDKKQLRTTHFWGKAETSKGNDVKKLPLDKILPEFTKRILHNRILASSNVESIGTEFAQEKKFLLGEGIRSQLTIPLQVGGSVIGALTFNSLKRGRTWSDELIQELRLLGEIFTNALIRKRADEKIRSSLHEKEILLKEIHHRVKNNMQIISSLMSLQSRRTEDEKMKNLFDESQSRIRSMALVHEQLYQSEDLAKIDFKAYVRSLTNELIQLYLINTKMIQLVIDIENIQLSVDTAIPYALIINELVSNSLKYAFPEGEEGIITVRFCNHHDDGYTLTVSDNGIGLPEEFDLKNTETLGLQLVRILVKQLKGNITVNRERGTAYLIVSPSQE
jgi:PAS domain S-box-containing protein